MKRCIPLVVAMGFVGVALAQAPAFEEVDTNSDGEISEEEFTVIEGRDFVKCDTNEDEYLSRREYAACTGGGE